MNHDEIIQTLQNHKLPPALVNEIGATILRLHEDRERAQSRIDNLRSALKFYADIENWRETAVTDQLTGNVNSDGDEEEVTVNLYLGEPLVWDYMGFVGPHLAQVALGMREGNDYFTPY